MSKKRNIKIVYQYDGSKFSGFQRQKNGKTVQGEIERIVLKNFSQKINMISAGRTDKGVHAMGQVSNFFIDEKIPLEIIKKQINKSLAGEVKILSVETVNDEFSARFDAKSRTYLYIMKKEEEITPFEASYVAKIKKDIKLEIFRKIINTFIGKHDFSSFMKKDRALRNTVREIYEIKCIYSITEKKYYIEISGSSFLKTMVRIMIGTALDAYFKGGKEDYIKQKLENPNVEQRKILSPAEGLYLYKVNY
ncbi:tRNA pseudouridine(38-40) synthase TruA [Leptotrichia sp. OH3620_COT-345]|uniref:tRNA pseudouridine(38-40) synthase TruA n=1 Tax=Leptotrichia sp. OH3620_COT-345 TaxID=2491048 RepID=UPI000F647091|nr:tRNA pseudouridine(38-40) synthase TruA [Leptotrichia sp. OH3620_COT-345]RRD38465.1 tRNA pseudouridine(38-40) synthase TruA [Leptotrichia sp. OH3620_COT-345]